MTEVPPAVPLPLSASLRARLRPGVDAAALERFLAEVPARGRWKWVHALLASPTADDAAALGRPADAGAVVTYLTRDLAELWAAVEPGRGAAPS